MKPHSYNCEESEQQRREREGQLGLSDFDWAVAQTHLLRDQPQALNSSIRREHGLQFGGRSPRIEVADPKAAGRLLDWRSEGDGAGTGGDGGGRSRVSSVGSKRAGGGRPSGGLLEWGGRVKRRGGRVSAEF